MNTSAGPGHHTVRAVIFYRTESDGAEPHVPSAVFTEDRDGVWIEPLSAALELPHWCVRGPVHSDHALLRQRSIPMPPAPSHDRLEYFTKANLSGAMVGRYCYGDITQRPDWQRSAAELAGRLARELAAAR